MVKCDAVQEAAMRAERLQAKAPAEGEKVHQEGRPVARVDQARNIYILIQIRSFPTHLKSAPGVPNVCSVDFLEGGFSSGGVTGWGLESECG